MGYLVTLKFFQDSASGSYGLAPKNSININEPFNAFWGGIGMFHDVFEHYFEKRHKFFKGKYAFNIGGEVAAMGHLAYFWERFRLEGRRNGSGYYDFSSSIVNTTFSEMQEGIACGYFNFGNELLCNVPRQKSIDSYMLDSIISDHFYRIRKQKVDKEDVKRNNGVECIKECYAYKKSITESKLKRLYTWGYRQAEMNVEDNCENRDILENFIKFWDNFCECKNAQSLSEIFDRVVFRITTGEEVKWNATFVTHEGQRIDYRKVLEYGY